MTRNLRGGIFCWLVKRHADNQALTLLGSVIEQAAAGSLQNRMARVDPEDIVVIDEDSQCLLVVDRRPGMGEVLEEHEECVGLTERDSEFLRVLRIRF